MKVLITGGHLMPALAVIEKLPKEIDIVYVGRKNSFEGDSGISLEYQKINSLGIKFVELKTGRLQRKFTSQTLPSLVKASMGFINSLRILKQEKPDLILGFGGYLSLPICLAGYFLKIPIIIHEQTMNAGLANKFIGKFADRICISWESSKKYFPNSILTGNPIFGLTKNNIDNLLPESKEDLPLLVITGGSAGSHSINVLIQNSLEMLLENYKVLHQTGDTMQFKDFENISEMLKNFSEKLKNRYSISKFFDPEASFSIYDNADLVICRSGINTVTQLFILQKKSVFIPLPYGQKNEQFMNAKFMEERGLCKVLVQNISTPDNLMDLINLELNEKIPKISTQDKNLISLHENASQNIVSVILLCLRKRSIKESSALS